MPLIISLYAAWASMFTVGKLALSHSTPLFFTGSRLLFSGLLILLFLIFSKKHSLKITKKQILPLLLLAILGMYLTNFLEYWGMQHVSAGKASFIYSLTPFFAAIFSYLHFKEKMTQKKWLGMLIGFAGVVPAMFIATGSEKILGGIGIFSWPEIALIGATLFSVYGWVLLRLLVKDNSLSPLVANSLTMLLGGVLALIHSFVSDGWTPIPIKAGHMEGFINTLFITTFVSNIVCFNLYGYLLKKYTATFLSFVGLLCPFFASLSEWIILKQPPSLIILGSSLIIMFGLWIVYQEELKQGYIQKSKKAQHA